MHGKDITGVFTQYGRRVRVGLRTNADNVNKPNAHSSAHAWVKGHGSLVM